MSMVSNVSSRRELEEIAKANDWSKADVTRIWNENADAWGVKPMKLFKNRPYGLDKIWGVLKKLKPKAESNGSPRGEKMALVLELLRRPDGVSGKELQSKLGWEPHSVRGFLSTLRSKHGVKVESERRKDGCIYKVSA